VPCYNYGRFLSDCLASIFQQEGEQDFEIVAIDDASTDNTIEVLESLADPRLRVVRHARNLGHVATVNEGLSLARGELIARIDPDDRYRPRFLVTALTKFQEFPDVGLVYGDAALIDEGGRVTVERGDRVHAGRDFKGNEFLRLLEHNCICAPTAIARRKLWEAALPVPDGLAFNDWYFNLMMARTSDFYFTNTVLADYRVHAHNHHTKIVLDKSEERSILSLLDRVFGELDTFPHLERAKRRARSRVYGRQYLTLADKYFGAGMNADALRCYWAALRNDPSHALNPGLQRRLAATIVGREWYERGKTLFRGAAARN